jgi:hypothetical protein
MLIIMKYVLIYVSNYSSLFGVEEEDLKPLREGSGK